MRVGFGAVVRSDGSKVDGSATISTSWNGEKAYPRSGQFTLDLGSDVCGESVEVFVNGYSVGRHRISSGGFTTINVTLKGSSDVPVR